MVLTYTRSLLCILVFSTTLALCKQDIVGLLQQGGSQIIPLFSPRENLKKPLSDLIKREQESICISAYNLTCQEIVAQLIAAYERGVSVEVITGNEGIQGHGERVTTLWESGIPVYVAVSHGLLMHHKYVIFSKNIRSKPVLWTGSGNLTERGLTKNYENIVVITDEQVVDAYRSDFNWLKKKIQDQTDRIIAIAKPHGTMTISLIRGMLRLVR